jgi:hypothetical protein
VLTGLAVAGFLVEVVATRRSAASRARA